MCTNPLTVGDLTRACRKCNDCLNTRKNDWVARACAEKEMSAFTYSVTLTYGSDTAEKEEGAISFRYPDVQVWLAHLREIGKREFGSSFQIRYICIGETGSTRGRVHWHVLLYSSHDVLTLGKFKNFHTKKALSHRDDAITEGKRVKRLSWSVWPHGLVTFQEPDRGGIAYAMKYILKEAFNPHNSKGTQRETKVQRYGASFFRQSRKPPIGVPYIDRLIAGWSERAICPTSFNIRLPESSGYWYPSRTIRKMMALGIHKINQRRIVEAGNPCPQFRALCANFTEDHKEWEWLHYGETFEEPESIEKITADIESRREQYDTARNVRARARDCGKLVPCRGCLAGLAPQDFDQLTADIIAAATAAGSLAAAERNHATKNKTGPYCGAGPNKPIYL